MYNHKLSPPVHTATISPRAPTSSSHSNGYYSSTTQRRDNDRPTSPLSDQSNGTTAAPTSGPSTTPSSSSLTTALYAMKKARQQQPESPKSSKKRGRGVLSWLVESRPTQALFLLSVAVNLVLLIVVLSSYSRSMPVCLHNANPMHAEDMQVHSQVLGLHNLDTGNSNHLPSTAESAPQLHSVTPTTEAVQIQSAPVDTPTSPAVPTTTDLVIPPSATEVKSVQPVKEAKQSQQPAPSAKSPAAVNIAAADVPSPQHLVSTDRPFANDISDNEYNIEAHTITWEHCLTAAEHVQSFSYEELTNLTIAPDFASFPSEHCPTTPTVEQSWQIGWYGGQVAVNVKERNFPLPQKCVQLPPAGYHWPKKYTDLPAADQSFLHWPNLRVDKYEELIVFNEGTPKNLYHFNAPQYDLDGLDELSLGARYIPFAKKIRNFLDIGAGGGSLGLLLKRKYGVEAMSIIFPDWPYCEYITERGGLCVLVDVMEAMPFARASFDAVHISWVYHGQQPAELVQMYTEVDRIVRPGGYVWQRGGWSLSQIAAQKALLAALGYVQLYERLDVKPEDITKRISFGPGLPFEAEWTCIYVKPIRAERKAGCDTAPTLMTVGSGLAAAV